MGKALRKWPEQESSGNQLPMPGVFESRYLRLGLDAGFVFEKNVVVPVRIKRRIEIYKIDTSIRKIIPVLQDLQIIAVVKGIHGNTGNVTLKGRDV
jgi:hypothetical protein